MRLKILEVKESSGETINSPEAVASIMTGEAKADRECFWILHLNTANRVIEKELISVGILSSSMVHPREVFKKAILNGTASLITVHNHPSSNPEPSKEDIVIWERLDKAGEILEIGVLDHLIITPSGDYYSKRQANA